jgi:hypothetical protein
LPTPPPPRPPPPALLQAFGGIKLFQFVRGTTAGQWELVSSSARPRFYDANEDSRGAKPSYFMEIEQGGGGQLPGSCRAASGQLLGS